MADPGAGGGLGVQLGNCPPPPPKATNNSNPSPFHTPQHWFFGMCKFFRPRRGPLLSVESKATLTSNLLLGVILANATSALVGACRSHFPLQRVSARHLFLNWSHGYLQCVGEKSTWCAIENKTWHFGWLCLSPLSHQRYGTVPQSRHLDPPLVIIAWPPREWKGSKSRLGRLNSVDGWGPRIQR